MKALDPVEGAIACLETGSHDLVDPPAMVVLPPDSGRFIVGNRGGFIRLAVASLKAARGEEQSFKKMPWVRIEDLDWGVDGLKLDPSAHIYLPTKPSRFQKMRSQFLGILLVLLVALCVVVGLATIVHWLYLHV